jgi:hypothetical protein
VVEVKTLIIREHNGGWCVFWKCDGYTVFESYHATKRDADRHVGKLCKEYGYVRVDE